MTKSSFVNYIVELLSPYGSIKSKSMFGGYGLYCNNKIFALIIDDELYFKADKDLAIYYELQGSEPFTYKSKGKEVKLFYFKVLIEVIEDEELLKLWFNKTMNVVSNI